MNIDLLKKLSVIRGKLEKEKFAKLYEEQPEIKRYISRPAKKKIIKPGKNIIKVVAIRVEFVEDDDTTTTGNGLIDIDHNQFPYDSLGYPTVGYRVIDTVDGKVWLDTPFDSIVNGRGYHNLYYDPPHTKRYFEHLLEFVKNYWEKVSYGNISIDFKVMPEAESTAYKLPHTLTYYGDIDNWVRGLLCLFRDAILASDYDINYSQYDAVVIFHAGSMWQTDLIGNSPRDIPAVFVSNIDEYFGTPIWTDNGTTPIIEGIIYPETAFQDGMPAFMQGGLCHEFGHQFGLPDLYDTELRTIGIGGWSLMGTGNWNLDGILPPHICAWSAEKLGFVQPIIIDKDTSVNIKCRSIGGEIYKIYLNSSEYFLISNRIAYSSNDTTGELICFKDVHWNIPSDCFDSSAYHYDSTGIRIWKNGVLTYFNDFDWSLPSDSMKGGLDIWHIDNNKIAKDSTENRINVGTPKGVDMEEADGIQDFETPWWLASDLDALFYGSKWDLFFSGSADRFDMNTSPNTNDNTGTQTYISIYNISQPDTIMNFSVKFIHKYGKFPFQCGSFFDVNSIKMVENKIICGCMDTNIIHGIDTTFGCVIAVLDSLCNFLWADTILDVNLFSSCAIGDINGNDTLDIVITPFIVLAYTSKMPILLQNIKNAYKDTLLKFEGYLYAYDIYGKKLFNMSVCNGEIVGAPLLADINNDGSEEIFFGSTDGYLYGFDGSGNKLQGFPVNLHEWIWSTPIYDSLNKIIYSVAFDGEIKAISTNGEIKYKVIEPDLNLTTSSPVLADINGDNKREIILCKGNGSVYCISDSEIIWERKLADTAFYSSPSIADIDNDGLLDIIILAGKSLYVLNSNGINITGFPLKLSSAYEIQSSPIIGDIDKDNEQEIIISAGNTLFIYDNKGKIKQKFSLGANSYSTPLICDINKDNKMEIFVGCDDGKIYGWQIDKYGDISWGMFHYNPSNNRVYEKISIIPKYPANIFTKSDFYIYPNPVKSSGYIHYLSGPAEYVNIKILNLAGDIVHEFDGKIAKDNYQDVLLPNLASGVYLVRVEVKVGNEKYVRFKKFSVIK